MKYKYQQNETTASNAFGAFTMLSGIHTVENTLTSTHYPQYVNDFHMQQFLAFIN